MAESPSSGGRAGFGSRLVAATEGGAGGAWHTADGRAGRWAAASLPGPLVDTYSAGDCFAAALGFAIARGDAVEPALAFAATRGAAALCRPGSAGRWRERD